MVVKVFLEVFGAEKQDSEGLFPLPGFRVASGIYLGSNAFL